jgi:hypothetical protein
MAHLGLLVFDGADPVKVSRESPAQGLERHPVDSDALRRRLEDVPLKIVVRVDWFVNR